MTSFVYLRFRTIIFSLISLLALFSVVFVNDVFAQSNIDATNNTAQYVDTDLDSNGTKDRINWNPANGGAVIAEGQVTGDIFSEATGWIRLDPSTSNIPPANLALVDEDDVGVQLTCSGNTGVFSGYAWGENEGWINFETTNGDPVTLSSSGYINGNAWSPNFGWIDFTCPGTDTCVQTTFRCEDSGTTTDGGSTRYATCNLEAIPSTISAGQSVNVIWNSNNVTDATFEGASISPSIGSLAGPEGSVIVTPTSSTTYHMNIDGSFMSTGSCSIEVTVSDVSVIQLVNTTYTVNENAGTVTISLERVGNVAESASVTINTSDATALSPNDYIATQNQVITWSAGDYSVKTVTFSIVDDNDVEIDELFRIILSAPVNAMLGSRTEARVTIIDNDIDPNNPGQVRFVQDTYQVTEGGDATVQVTRIGGSYGEVAVRLSSSDGTATQNDYETVDTIITWNDGESGIQTVVVSSLDDLIEELSENFLLTLDNATGATLASPYTAIVTILDNDALVQIVGCLDPNAQNYNANATQHDASSCIFVEGVVFGCTDSEALNYNTFAEEDNGSCQYEGENNDLITGNTNNNNQQQGGGTKKDNLLRVLALLGLVVSLPGVISRVSNILLSFVAVWKKHRPWGTVYDATTKQPLDPAYVILYNEQDEEVASAITDADGRYGFVVEPGIYYLSAQKTHYAFPSRMMNGKQKDDLYDDLYYGEKFEVKEDGNVITKNIPLDPVEEDWNEEEKRDMGKNIFSFFSRNDRFFVRLTNILFVVGFAFSVYAMIVSPVLWNYIVFAVYILMIILFVVGFAPVTSGKVTEKGKPLPYAILRIFNAYLNKEMARKVLDEDGNYFVLVKRGEYYVTVERKELDGSYTHIYTSDTFKARRGIINKRIDI